MTVCNCGTGTCLLHLMVADPLFCMGIALSYGTQSIRI